MGRKYWNIYKILPYQRNFNFINGERSIGKSYTTQKFVLERCINKSLEFIYIVRTQDEKKRGIFNDAFKKVLANEFPNTIIETTNEEMYVVTDSEDSTDKKLIGYCVALSEAVKLKKKSFPNVKYMVFDEYMLEEKQGGMYVNGWKEPDLFLSIYHTVDREQDRVVCFLLGNNTSFYNPYHMHKAFNIPYVEKGTIWYNDFVLFEWAVSSELLTEDKNQCKFLKMLKGTEYGNYAKDGNYVDDNINFIEEMSGKNTYIMTIVYNGNSFGVFSNYENGKVYISGSYDSSYKTVYALTINDHKENTLLTKDKKIFQLKWLAKNFKLGNIRYTDMYVKMSIEKGIEMLL